MTYIQRQTHEALLEQLDLRYQSLRAAFVGRPVEEPPTQQVNLDGTLPIPAGGAVSVPEPLIRRMLCRDLITILEEISK